MLQAYAPRDPLAEVLSGRITVRKFRVMVEHLPDGNVFQRAVADAPWTSVTEQLLYHIESRVRDAIVANSNLWRSAKEPPIEASYLEPPPTAEELEARRVEEERLAAQREREAAELKAGGFV